MKAGKLNKFKTQILCISAWVRQGSIFLLVSTFEFIWVAVCSNPIGLVIFESLDVMNDFLSLWLEKVEGD